MAWIYVSTKVDTHQHVSTKVDTHQQAGHDIPTDRGKLSEAGRGQMAGA